MFLPIGDVHDSEEWDPPYATVGLIAVNVLVFLFFQPQIPAVREMSMIPADVRGFYDAFAVTPADISDGRNLDSLLTAMFLHGGWLHLGSNMLYLWIFGDNVEHAFGRLAFVGFYVVSGVVGSLAQVALFPDSTIWNLGASGAIAGVLAAYMVLFPRAWVNVLVVFFRITVTRVRAFLMIGLWFVLQLLSGGSQLAASASRAGGEGGGVAYWAHVGGFVAGLGVALLLGGRDAGPEMAQRERERTRLRREDRRRDR